MTPCSDCESRAEDCFETAGPDDGQPCTCSCHDRESWERSSGLMICAVCRKQYFDHPRGGPVGFDGTRFLRRLCGGGLVKL